MLFNFNNLIHKHQVKINGVIQVGAHYGTEINSFLQNGIKNIICFEPVPSTFEILKQNAENKAQLINLALGNENKTIEMNIETANNGQSNSILKPALHLIQYPHITFNSKIEVQMMRLDDFIKKHNQKNSQIDNKSYNFLCLDVQGYELEVFKGAKKFLNHIDYIMCEVNRDVVYHGCPMVNELDDYLKKYNFKRVETTWDGNTWGDAFYIKIK
jgi:FkbM family methyltransferase